MGDGLSALHLAFLGIEKYTSDKINSMEPCSHLFKCIRNNWLNQKNDGRCFFYPKFDSVHAVQDIADFKAARFTTITELYNLESDKIVKYGFRLNLKALAPSSMERKNVKLVLCIFNEHATEARAELGEKNKLLYSKDTSDFLKIIIRWQQIVNVKTPNKGKRLNNRYQEPLSYDEKYLKMAFLEKFLKWIDDWEKMKFSTGTFTKETRIAIVLSTKAIIEISSYCKGNFNMSYVLPVVDILTGIVIDYEILSKYFPECTAVERDHGEQSADFLDLCHEAHKPECSENYVGSSNAMEVKAAEILWKRSVENCVMRYMSVLSDDDSKTYQDLLEFDVYDDSMNISKEECLNHVAKRLGTGLRNKVKEWRSKCVTNSGRKEGSLKESTIFKHSNFYRKAITESVPDVQKMKTAIFASLFHNSSTYKAPKHNKFPTGLTSWSFYQNTLANNEKPVSFVTEDKAVRATFGKNAYKAVK
ncbi:hypothetical protein AVEN_128683-1 [Araneus ventricosus]|uniref:Mutator-like transposase domain-containing protein n=1 Tax=Araneus ventricosus TaxID=182803 RepID=A0A4Y2T0I9_ARAVE|nr:hypothetical protein AVEN_128683-1 [Araneus ventricosus]